VPVAFSLGFVPPFRLDLTVWALRRRPENLVDRWDGETYRRVLVIDDAPCELVVRQVGTPDSGRLRVHSDLTRRHADARPRVATVVERLLGLRCNLSTFYSLADNHAPLRLLTARFRGLKPPRFPTIFEALVNAMACQQVSLPVGILLLNRLTERYGPPHGRGANRAHAFPEPRDLASLPIDSLRPLGFSRQKSRAIVELARHVVHGRLDLEGLAPLDDAALGPWLRTLRGVGPWTADYALLRGYGRLAMFPVDDVGGRNRLQRWLGLTGAVGPERAQRVLAPWQPYGGLIYFHLLLNALERAGYVTL
jgi:DNA-3-methyladenine glycosylase II